jgi:hypothetical protein
VINSFLDPLKKLSIFVLISSFSSYIVKFVEKNKIRDVIVSIIFSLEFEVRRKIIHFGTSSNTLSKLFPAWSVNLSISSIMKILKSQLGFIEAFSIISLVFSILKLFSSVLNIKTFLVYSFSIS